MYDYPLMLETKVAMEVAEAQIYQLRAWELILKPGGAGDPATGEYETYPVPEHLGPGYLGLVWNGSVHLEIREDGPVTASLESGLGVFFFDQVANIQLPEGVASAQVVVIAVLDSAKTPPDLRLPERGDGNDLSMPDIPLGVITVILRQLRFSPHRGDPAPLADERWPRPGYFLSTIDGPRAGEACGPGASGDAGGELDFIALPMDQNARYCLGRVGEGGNPLAYIIDLYAEGDPSPGRSAAGGPEPGCRIRCWGP